MDAQVVPTSSPKAAGAARNCVIEAVDLMDSTESRGLWRGRTAPSTAAPAGGIPSPMGFLLTQRNEPAAAASPWLVRLFAPGDEPAAPAVAPPGRFARTVQTVRIKGVDPADGDLALTIGPEGVQVVASAATWEALSEPVLLAVCQYWRLRAVDVELDYLAERAYGDISHAAVVVPSSLWQRRRLLEHAGDVRTLLLDLPHFQEPLTDPYPFCSSERSVQAYRSLAEKLHLEEWSEAIDHRFEAIEDVYASITEKLNEYRNFAWGATFEITIVVILLVDLTLNLIGFFAE